MEFLKQNIVPLILVCIWIALAGLIDWKRKK